VTFVLDIMPVVGYLWAAANAWCGERSKDGRRWVQAQRTELLPREVGDVIGGLRQILTKRGLRKSVRETLAKSSRSSQHRRWMKVRYVPGDGFARGPASWSRHVAPWVKHRMEGEGKRWSLEGPRPF